MLQVFHLPGKGVGQASHATHSHPHREVVPLANAGRNVHVSRLADNLGLASAHANGGRVAGLWRVVVGLAVNLHQLRVVDLTAESILNGLEIWAMAVRGHLDAIGEPSRQIMHEVVSGIGIPVAYIPARYKLGFGINCGPRPNVAPAMTLFFCGNVRFLGSHERPNFVALDTLARKIAESFVLKFRAGFSEIGQKPHYRTAMNASHAGRCAERISQISRQLPERVLLWKSCSCRQATSLCLTGQA